MLKGLWNLVNPAIVTDTAVKLFNGETQVQGSMPFVASVDSGLTFGPNLPSAEELDALKKALVAQTEDHNNDTVSLTVTPAANVTVTPIPTVVPTHAPTANNTTGYVNSAYNAVVSHPAATVGVVAGTAALAGAAYYLTRDSKIDPKVAFAKTYAIFESKKHILNALAALKANGDKAVIVALNNQDAATAFASLNQNQLNVFINATTEEKMAFIKGILPVAVQAPFVEAAALQQSRWGWVNPARNSQRITELFASNATSSAAAASSSSAADAAAPSSSADATTPSNLAAAVLAPVSHFNADVMVEIDKLADESKRELARQRAQDPKLKFKPEIVTHLNKNPAIAAQLLGQKQSYFDQFMSDRITLASQKLKLARLPEKIALQQAAARTKP